MNTLPRLLLPLVAVLALGCRGTGIPSTATSGGDWVSYRGDNTLCGSVEIPLPESPTLLWSTSTGQRTTASPLVKDGVVYTITRKGVLHGYDKDGNSLFTKDLETYVEATPLILDTMMFIGTMDGYMMPMGLGGREIKWNFPTQGQISSPATPLLFQGESAIVFGSYDSHLYALRPDDGKCLGRIETGYYLNGAAAVQDSHLFFGGCDSWLRIVDTGSGVQTDSLQLDSYIPASPAIRGNDLYVGDYSGNIYHLAVEEGRISSHGKIHSSDPSEGGSFLSIPAVGRNFVYFYTGGRSLRCLSRKDHSTRWETMLKGETGESPPIECPNGILVCTKGGVVSILDPRDGSPKWEYDTGEDILSCPAIVPGRFYILTAKGTLLCFGK